MTPSTDPLCSYAPIDVGRTLRLVPPGLGGARSADRIEVVLERGAFGSGEHETTVVCLELLEELGGPDGTALHTVRRVLDVGSGTGVLSIAAVVLGAARAICVDPDPLAVECARRNGRLNGIERRIEHVCGVLDDVPTGTFDLVLANLYGFLLLVLAPALVARCSPGATLLLSGMLWEQDWEVRACFTALGCTERAHRMMDEFSAVLLEAPK
jgi:ribosomal protein L11 methyltransferase